MHPLDFTVTQLKRAATIREQIETLTKELKRVLGASMNDGAAPTRPRTMSAAQKRKIAAAQRARWAKVRREQPAASGAKGGTTAKKRRMSPATRAKVAARMKAYWAKKRSSKK